MTDSPKFMLRFGPFELDARSAELRKAGGSVRLAEKPRQALLLLVEHAGDIVTREQLRRRLWPADTFVEFDDNLNATIKRLREVLGDSAVGPKFIETLPRRGYKFVATVERIADPLSAQLQSAESSAGTMRQGRRPVPALAGVVLASAIGVSGALLWGAWRHAHANASTQQPPQVVLAVMPVANLTGSSNRQFLADGLTEDLIAKLERVSPQQLAVIARPSVLRVSPDPSRSQGTAQRLGADFVLWCRLRGGEKAGAVEARLIRARDQRQLWTGTFQLPLQETFLGVVVTRRVADALGIRPEIRNRTELSRRDTSGLTAYEMNLRGLYALHRENKADLLSAIDSFEESLRHDPQFAMPLAGEARAYLWLSSHEALPKSEAERKAEAAVGAGMLLDPAIAEFYILRGDLRVTQRAANGDIERDYQRALELDSNDTEALEHYALYLRERRPADALQYIERARHLDPLSPRINAISGWVLASAGKLEEADARLRSALALDPQFPATLSFLGNLETRRGHSDQAIAWFEKAANASGREPQHLYRLGRAYAEAGRKDDVKRVLAELREEARSRRVEPSYTHTLEEMLGG